MKRSIPFTETKVIPFTETKDYLELLDRISKLESPPKYKHGDEFTITIRWKDGLQNDNVIEKHYQVIGQPKWYSYHFGEYTKNYFGGFWKYNVLYLDTNELQEWPEQSIGTKTVYQ